MGRKKNTSTNHNAHSPALKIGSRVRCTDDGVTGRIVWANVMSVKVKWDDGEQVTWKRDSLATRLIEILDADGDDEQPTAPAITTAAEPTATTEQPETETETAPTATEQPQTEPETVVTTEPTTELTTLTTEPTATEAAALSTEPTVTESEPTPTEPIATEVAAVPEATAEQATPSTDAAAAPMAAKLKRQRKAPAEPKEKKVSALDAAAKVLAEEAQPMSCKELIAAMAAKGYWTSPGGKTPDATLYSAILRELDTKGSEARFVKAERGKFARK